MAKKSAGDSQKKHRDPDLCKISNSSKMNEVMGKEGGHHNKRPKVRGGGERKKKNIERMRDLTHNTQ